MRRQLALFSLLFVFVPGIGFSQWTWPLKNPLVVKDFASDRGDGFSPGVWLSQPKSAKVQASASGELVFRSRKAAGADGRRFDFSSILKGVVIIEHSKGFRTVYGNLDPYVGIPSRVNQGESLGELRAARSSEPKPESVSGASGTKKPAGESADPLFFVVYDQARGGAVNPFILLPGLPDDRSPVLNGAKLLVGQSGRYEELELKNNVELAQQNPVLYLLARDIVATRADLVSSYGGGNSIEPNFSFPFRLSVFLNGDPIFKTQKTYLRNSSDRRTLKLYEHPSGNYGDLYDEKGFARIGELTLKPGLNRIEIRSTDAAGNSAGARFLVSYSPPRVVSQTAPPVGEKNAQP